MCKKLDGSTPSKTPKADKLRFLGSVIAPIFVTLVAVVFFLIQARHLHTAAYSYTDEGIHVAVASAMLEGRVPYRDFFYGHPPGLPTLIAVGLKVFDSLYPIRIAYLFFNCFCIIPLYFAFCRLCNNWFAALVGACSYIAYYDMMHHDGRFMALRQCSSALLILYLYLSTRPRQGKFGFLSQVLTATANFLIYFQSGATILLVSLAHVLGPLAKGHRLELLKRYIWIATISLGIVAVLFSLLPGSFDNIVTEHLVKRPRQPFQYRLNTLTNVNSKNFYLFSLSISTLILSALFVSSTRTMSLASLGMIAIVFPPGTFFPHYYVIAAPAFAFGMAAIFPLVNTVLKGKWKFIPYGISALALCLHWNSSVPGLFNEWNNHRNPSFYRFVDSLKKEKSPMLTFFDSIAILEARKTLVDDYRIPEFRTYGGTYNRKLSEEDYALLYSKACTVVISNRSDKGYVPQKILEKWISDGVRRIENRWATIIATGNKNCVTP